MHEFRMSGYLKDRISDGEHVPLNTFLAAVVERYAATPPGSSIRLIFTIEGEINEPETLPAAAIVNGLALDLGAICDEPVETPVFRKVREPRKPRAAKVAP